MTSTHPGTPSVGDPRNDGTQPAIAAPPTGGDEVRGRLSRRRFLAAGAAIAGAAAVAGCSNTYDVASGFAGRGSGGSGKTIVYWNLLSGGDGARMQAMEAVFEKAHPDVHLDATILSWGNPYYTKLAMATRSGSPPDVAILHADRLYEFGPPKLVTPLDLDLLAEHDIHPSDFTPKAFAQCHFDGRLMAIPLDTHPIVQYYNTAVCKKAGLLDHSGELPPVTSAAAMLGVLRKLKAIGVTPVVCDQVGDPATAWRLFYTLYSQAGGKVLADNGTKVVLDEVIATRVLAFIYQLAKEGLMDSNTDANGGVALFEAGTAGLYWEGEWNVTVFQTGNLPFNMQAFPALFGSNLCWADSHTFVLPTQPSHDPEQISINLTMIRTLLGQSYTWAEGGHIPAWLPVRQSAAYERLKPQSNYQDVANHVVYDPPAWYSGAGSDMENYAGNAIGPVMLGGLSPESAYKEVRASFDQLAKETVPV
jgi:multiple sugar transport system substrate-binding protein